MEYLDESARQIQSAKKREYYHAPYSTDALDYEVMEYADKIIAAIFECIIVAARLLTGCSY